MRIAERLSGPTLKGVFIEFLVIFLGVYVAYLFSDFQENQRERRTQIKYCATLIEEFRFLDLLLAQQQARIAEDYRPVLAAMEAGERPALHVAPLFFDFRGLTIEAAFRNDENFNALPDLILANLTRGHTAIAGIRSRVEQLRANLSTIGRTGVAPEQLYEADGALREEFSWYPRLVREIEAIGGQTRTALGDAIAGLEAHKRELEERDWW